HVEIVPDNYQVVSDEELNFKVPEGGVHSNGAVPFDEAMSNWEENYKLDPAKTIHELGTLVLSQRTQLQQQDKFIREMHAAVRHMDRILRDYVHSQQQR